MDDAEFRRLLDLFPIVRSRDYHAESEQSRESTSKSAQHEEHKEWQDAWDEGDKIEVEKQGLDEHGEFWEKLKLVAERKKAVLTIIHEKEIFGASRAETVEDLRSFVKVGAAEAERFCKAFQRIHEKLVYEELSLDAAQKFLNSS